MSLEENYNRNYTVKLKSGMALSSTTFWEEITNYSCPIGMEAKVRIIVEVGTSDEV